MADKELSLILRVKNAMQVGLAKAKSSLGSFASGAMDIAKSMTKWFAAATGAMAAGLGVAMVKAQEFNKQIAQVATISNVSTAAAAKGVRKLSAEFGLAKEELTKGLYDALSAGVPSENAFEFLRVASKAAVAGATETAKSVDFLTTALNAFKIPVEQAEQVADTLFTTVRLGKTTVEELAANFATVGPIAASSGVAFEQVMAAAATLTKQGTPTAQAMTQIRAAIIAMNKTLGDGWSSTMTLQEGMEAMRQRAGGSNVELQKLTGRVEGMNAILGVTGENAAMAAEDLRAVANGAGAMNSAFEIANKAAPLDKLKQSLSNVMMVLGDKALQAFGPAIERGARAIAEFAERVNTWAADEKMAAIATSIDGIVQAMTASAETRGAALEAISGVLVAAFKYAASEAVSILHAGAVKLGELIAAGVKRATFGPSKAEIEAESAAIRSQSVEARVSVVGAEQAIKDFQAIGYTAHEASLMVAEAVKRMEQSERDRLRGAQRLRAEVENLLTVGQRFHEQLAKAPDTSGTVTSMNAVAGAIGNAAVATRVLAESNREVGESAGEMAEVEEEAFQSIVSDADTATVMIHDVNRQLTGSLGAMVDERVDKHTAGVSALVQSELAGANAVRAAWREANAEIYGGTVMGKPGSANARRGDVQLIGGLPQSSFGFSNSSIFGSGVANQLNAINGTLGSIDSNIRRSLSWG